MDNKKTYRNLFLACLVTMVMGTLNFIRVAQSFTTQWVPHSVQYAVAILFIVTMIIMMVVWRRKASSGTLDTDRYTSFFQSVVYYIIAFDLITFSGQKIMHLQFNVPLGVLDNPFNAVPRDLLMWAFYGNYYSMIYIVACMQATGALMLLFRKTRLAGVFVLLPILLNVTLLDYYYLNFFVILYATIESLTLVYLLLLDYDRLKQIFFKQESNVRGPQFKQRWLKWAVKASAVLIPVILLSIYPYYAKFDRELAGKYIVKQIRPTPAPCKDSVLTKIFIDHSDFVLEYGSYERRFIGNYQYNKTNQTITVIWRYPANMHDTLRVKITPDAEKKVKNFRCFMGKDTFNVKAQKVAPINR